MGVIQKWLIWCEKPGTIITGNVLAGVPSIIENGAVQSRESNRNPADTGAIRWHWHGTAKFEPHPPN